MFFLDECDQKPECSCTKTKFNNDSNHQYILSNSHRLLPDKRLDLVALMQYDTSLLSSPIHHSPTLVRNPSNSFVSVSCRKLKETKNKEVYDMMLNDSFFCLFSRPLIINTSYTNKKST